MKKMLFWRLFIVLSLGVVIFFSLIHSAAILSNEKMSYLKKSHRQQILDWGNTAQTFIDQQDWHGLDVWLEELAIKESTWATVLQSHLDVKGGNPLNQRFWQGYGIGRSVEWKIHLDFPDNPIMEVPLSPFGYHFLILLPDRMRPGTYMSHAFWLFRFVIPFLSLLALTVYLYRYVMRPLQQFHRASQAFSQGDYSARIGHTMKLGDDEISQVARTFDKMAERTSDVIQHNRNLIADMSHEIRTPLARIEMAIDCVDKNIEREQMLERIKSDTQKMRATAEDTLTLAWIENEQPNLRTESFDLAELIEIIVEDARFEYPDKQVSLLQEHSLPLQDSNQMALCQSLENIIRNGLRYTQTKETLDIRVLTKSNHYQILITDSGPGIDPSLYRQIFKPFFKANNQVTSRKGFGVGLALAKRHIEAVGGKVIAYNAEQKGLTMDISVPKRR
ncbi:sensor histidine kinase [Vibrio rotiferianus]|uniref:sensor histidine kinase n=1 Tax=Vibrio rotiferianus TaxID=190895 RepID=UPI00039D1E53|nr:sensor histidine kinase [Vibrio rotiferianus]PIB12649.1 histidine kinase [Vibrio rotiferianus CAIM 577 = LMG 21460]